MPLPLPLQFIKQYWKTKAQADAINGFRSTPQDYMYEYLKRKYGVKVRAPTASSLPVQRRGRGRDREGGGGIRDADCTRAVGLSTFGAGGSIVPPKTGGGGGVLGSIDRTINQLL